MVEMKKKGTFFFISTLVLFSQVAKQQLCNNPLFNKDL